MFASIALKGWHTYYTPVDRILLRIWFPQYVLFCSTRYVHILLGSARIGASKWYRSLWSRVGSGLQDPALQLLEEQLWMEFH